MIRQSRAQALAGLTASPDPASQLRLVRMRGSERLSPAQLRDSHGLAFRPAAARPAGGAAGPVTHG